ncbi:MAG: thioredoxin family protein [candidate division Zixibacteria bacterium]|nr:thioredoxin family protein [candidate division Zixibacteria bacterium]
MKIQVLGPGCPKCKETAEVMKKAAEQIGLIEGKDYQFEKVEQVSEIMKFGVMFTPGVVIDGKVVSSGKPLSPDQARQLLMENLDK